jgi:hypothetical protein
MKTHMPFGRHKGVMISSLPTPYLIWLAGIALFDDLREAVDAEMIGRGLEPPADPPPPPPRQYGRPRPSTVPTAPPEPPYDPVAVVLACHEVLVEKWARSSEAVAALNESRAMLTHLLRQTGGRRAAADAP